MRTLLCALAFSAATAPALLAQVDAEIVFDQEQFLRNESLPLRLRISNFSGQTLKLGGEPDWVSFSVENREAGMLPRRVEVASTKPFTIESSGTSSLKFDLMPQINLSQPGHYTVTAKIKLPQLQREVTTVAKGFDVVSGVKLWEREVGMPATSPPVVRKFALQQATFLKQERLYVRVTDASESKVFEVLPMGRLTSFGAPEALVDNSSQLHVLFQSGPKSFVYCVVTPDGEHIIRQTWDYRGESRPRLHAEEDGRVIVHGGERRILLSDLPPPRVANTDDKVEPK